MKRLVSSLISLTLMTVAPGALADRYDNARVFRVASPAYSQSTEGYRVTRNEYDFAEVLEVRPIVRIVTVSVPQRECWEQEVYVEQRRRRGTAGATIAGGLLGGVIGRQFGGGSGRDAMTVVGAIVGSAVGNDRAEARRGDGDGYFKTVQRCETRNEVREEERIDGYEVTYFYDGREYTTRTRNDPGSRLRVRISVDPAGRY